MARGKYESNVKEFYTVGSVTVQKFTSSFVGGKGANINDGMEHVSLPDLLKLDPNEYNIIVVKGHSMYPTIEEGDSLLVDLYNEKKRPKRGDIVALELNGDLMVKLFEPGATCLFLTSINPEHEPIRVYEEDDCKLIGRAYKIIRDVPMY